jgi:hypothetical protein
MKVYTYSKARERLAAVLEESNREEVVIKRRKGDLYAIVPKAGRKRSPFDVPGVDAGITLKEILESLHESRSRSIKLSRRYR